jgi:hypothetical protein
MGHEPQTPGAVALPLYHALLFQGIKIVEDMGLAAQAHRVLDLVVGGRVAMFLDVRCDEVKHAASPVSGFSIHRDPCSSMLAKRIRTFVLL